MNSPNLETMGKPEKLDNVQLRSREAQRPNALEHSLLRTLPAELIREIVTYLPTRAAAALTLSCVQIKNIVGTQHLEALKGPPDFLQWGSWVDSEKMQDDTRIQFLRILQRDLPDLTLCGKCLYLTKWKSGKIACRAGCLNPPSKPWSYLAEGLEHPLAKEAHQKIDTYQSLTTYLSRGQLNK